MALRSIVGLVFMLIISSACVANPRPEMAVVPGGDFVMGMQDGEDNPIHAVRVNSYMLGKYEVTVGEWREFTEDADVPFPWNQFEFLSLVRRNVGFVLPDDWPIYYLTWYEAVWYCNWLSVREGLQPAYELDLQTLRRYLYEREDPAPQVIWNETGQWISFTHGG